ncbi:glycosyltransferase family 4 protein [Amphritea sp. 1_MG-2023]|uniref:glycosyltransferase family 4 protein n=1 Tax=Amphritea sp. 1_MG-2023 TaxID=3062670 RepID=UPI0026E2A3E8|nr:glycosyltransferase family 4 protein [Amphritea sp. 1_MG-2023]MDO6563774.1 glycosyltransferase family 4 protein [Amphritea sp. 1_MG-2023]
MTPIRPLFSLARYWPAVGGSELHTRELTQRLQPYADVRVVCHNSANGISNEAASAKAGRSSCHDVAVDVQRVGPPAVTSMLMQGLARLHPHLRAARPIYDELLRPLARQALFDASHDRDLIHGVYNGLTTVAESALWAARQRDIPFIWTPLAHTEAREGQAWSSDRFKHLYREADALIAMTAYERDWLIQRGARPSSTYICPVGPLLTPTANGARFRQAHGLGEAPMVLFLGRHVDSKGYRQLLEAAQKVWTQLPETRFVFIGPQTNESIACFAQQSDQRVLVLDQISDSAKNDALDACTMLCVPSTQESLGVTYIEAWHYSKPVIGADIEVLRSVIADQHDGLLTTPDSASLTDALLTLLTNPTLCQRLGDNGRQKLDQHYDWRKIATRMAAIYADVLNQKTPQQAVQ